MRTLPVNTNLGSLDVGRQPPVEGAGQPAAVQPPGVEQHIATLQVDSGHYTLQVGLTDHWQHAVCVRAHSAPV